MRRYLAILGVLVGCGADPKLAFECVGNAGCRDGDSLGVCEETGFCSFDDAACPEGRRYATAVGSGLGDQCVDVGAPPIGSWKSAPAIPVVRYSQATATDGNAIYALGGILGSTPRDDLWIADVSNGAISAWNGGTTLPEPRRAFGAAAFGGFVFAIGGRAGTTSFSADVLASPVGGGPWTPTTPLPGGLRAHAVVQSGNHVYVVGGKAGNNDGVTDVQIGTMANGTVEWRAGSPMTKPRFDHSATVANGYLYAIGGCPTGNNGCTNLEADVEFAKIESDGSLGPFQATTPLPDGRWHHTSAGNAHYLIVASGHIKSANNTADVLFTHINPDGSLGAWDKATPLVSGGGRKSAVAVGELVFVIASETQVASLRP